MSLFPHRLINLLTAVAVLVMGMDCACAGQMRSTGREVESASGEVMPCCAHHHDVKTHCPHQHRGPEKHKSSPCGSACEHCGQTVMNDTVAPPSHASSLVSHPFSPFQAAGLTLGNWGLDLSPRGLIRDFADLPPPLTSPTLLSLHCALRN